MPIYVKDLLLEDEKYDLKIKNITSNVSLNREIKSTNINRPGLALVGYFEDFAYERVQVFGKGEYGYLQKANKKEIISILKKFFEYPIPCCIFTWNNIPDKDFIRIAEEFRTPILVTSHDTNSFIKKISFYLNETLAPIDYIHGVLMEIFGIGVLITGKSGVGKSETALELIERGHLLIADDLIMVKNIAGDLLVGTSYGPMGYVMEIKGVGIVNIKELFGIKAIKEKKRIDLIIHLKQEDKPQDIKLKLEYQTENILGINKPKLVIPIKPGRNIATLIETAVINYRQTLMGYDTALEFEKAIKDWYKEKNG